jgi:hypothetical protein
MKKNQTPEIQKENEKINWLRWTIDLNIALLYQDVDLDLEAARQRVWKLRDQVLEVFPGKGFTFDLILLPRFNRVLIERWGRGIAND